MNISIIKICILPMIYSTIDIHSWVLRVQLENCNLTKDGASSECWAKVTDLKRHIESLSIMSQQNFNKTLVIFHRNHKFYCSWKCRFLCQINVICGGVHKWKCIKILSEHCVVTDRVWWTFFNSLEQNRVKNQWLGGRYP